MKKLKVELGKRSYDILIGYDIMSRLGEEMKNLGFRGRLLVITDENVHPLYTLPCLQSLEEAGFSVGVSVVAPGEESKSWPVAEKLFSSALDFSLDRDSGIVALGGGVVGDLAGFVAATYQRGVAYVQVPTTLLAQVDSSVGGKVAINHPRGKNMIGAFYQPRLVLADIKTLETLDHDQMRAGMAEVIKYGIIWDRGFFESLRERLDPSLSLDPAFFQQVVYRSCQVKGEVVSADEREGGLRAILNFGHTLGHALEAVTGYRYFFHGEAVHYGMLLATRLACRQGILDQASGELIQELLSRVGYRPLPPGLEVGAVMEALKYDKKRKGGKIVLVLPEKIGRVKLFSHIPPEEVKDLTSSFLQEFSHQRPGQAPG